MPHLHFHHRLGRLGYWCVRGSSGCRPGRRQCNGNFESGSCLAEIAFFAAGHLDVFSPIEPSALNGFRHCGNHRRRGEVIAHGFSWRGKRWGLSGTNAPTAGLRDRLSAAHTGRPSRVQQSLIISYDLSRNRAPREWLPVRYRNRQITRGRSRWPGPLGKKSAGDEQTRWQSAWRLLNGEPPLYSIPAFL
jgi:hypothetical protein